MGRDVRAWPMLALLFLVVLVAAVCVLWFMREAMRNERLSVREKLSEAYRGQLELVQTQSLERWKRWLGMLDSNGPPAANFERCIRDGLADSVLLFDAQGQITYPQGPVTPEPVKAEKINGKFAELRQLVEQNKRDAAIRFATTQFALQDLEEQGRQAIANAQLLVLEFLKDPNVPGFTQISDSLRKLIGDYQSGLMPSGQRRFLMSEMAHLVPTMTFFTQESEDLAARYLDSHPTFPRDAAVHPSGLKDMWAVRSPSGSVVALLSTTRLKTVLEALIHDTPVPQGISLGLLAPGDNSKEDTLLISVPFKQELPGWQLALAIDDRKFFETEAERRVKFYLTVACAVIAIMSALAFLLARSFGNQVALARLKNDLVATVSHELKTPLTAMRALVDTLLDTPKLDEKVTREYLQLISTENSRLSRLIENFLTFSRLERNKFNFHFAEVSPAQIVEGAVAAFGERGHVLGEALEMQVQKDLPVIQADRDALITALLNLLENAWKYTGEQKRIQLRAVAPNGAICFSVEDNGIGLAPQDRERVFQRFYQTDQRLTRPVEGCGLGLSIVQSIAEAHGGSVAVTSELNRGSTFTIRIPTHLRDGS